MKPRCISASVLMLLVLGLASAARPKLAIPAKPKSPISSYIYSAKEGVAPLFSAAG